MNDINTLFDSLNKEQQEAAKDIYGCSRIIAGPGAGKTKTIVVRTAIMLLNEIRAENILLSTFTKKAALEIKERVIDLIGDNAKRINVGTYHSICSRILRQYPTQIGVNSNFTILDADDCKKIIKDILKQYKYQYDVNNVLSAISNYKINLKSVVYVLKTSSTSTDKDLAKIYELYENALIKNNSLDFDNLIYKTIFLMQKYPEIKLEINNKYKYIIADEAHDSSTADLQLIRLLTGEEENLCLVLDNDQSIYKFRGSVIESVMAMSEIYPKMRTHLLNTNYRSTQIIVNASKSLISNNSQFVEKDLHSNNEIGNPIIYFIEKDCDKEAIRIVNLIKLSVNKYGYDYSDIAILYRINSISKPIESALLKYNIPYKLVGGTNFYSRKEIKDIFAYYNFILNPNDVMAFNRIMRTPKKGIGETTINSIISFAQLNQIDLITALNSYTFKGKIKENMEAFFEIINEIIELMPVAEPCDLISRTIELIGYYEYLNNAEKEEDAILEKISNLNELIEISKFYENIEELVLNSTIDYLDQSDKNKNNCVSLLSQHSSKGLEWPVVVIASAIEGHNPSWQAEELGDIEEERRLFYVACSRARKLLFITAPKYIKQKGYWSKTKLSRFIEELDEKYIYKYGE